MTGRKNKIDELLERAASEPLSADMDGQKIQNHSLRDLIEFAKFQNARKRARNPLDAIKVFKAAGKGTL